ncbi:nuclear transport factor 2 family protein [Aliikangiella maris]|uniref:Nuclear transport factor 2 family protein n=2 Tax=Aliikangiella maris TaxID=3162458 RepID=A0ABV2BR66_9GAMM
MKKNFTIILCGLVMFYFSTDCTSRNNQEKNNNLTQQHEIIIEQTGSVIDAFHLAAANADLNGYFNLLTDDAVFLGTDATERWTKSAFYQFTQPYFSQGKGWAYTPTKRHISVVNEQVVFFDELLYNKSYGECRGSGVLVKSGKNWKISQYNLSIPMPNGIAKKLVTQIADFKK